MDIHVVQIQVEIITLLMVMVDILIVMVMVQVIIEMVCLLYISLYLSVTISFLFWLNLSGTTHPCLVELSNEYVHYRVRVNALMIPKCVYYVNVLSHPLIKKVKTHDFQVFDFCKKVKWQGKGTSGTVRQSLSIHGKMAFS